MSKDYYDVLGVPKGADAQAIKKAYRNLAKKYHPDTNPGDKQAEQKFKEIGEAYSILSDPEKKKLYDQYGSAAFEQGGGPGAGGFYSGSGPNSSYQEFHFNGNAEDIFGDLFGGMFGGSGRRSKKSGSSGSRFGGFGGFGGFNGFGGQDPFGSAGQTRYQEPVDLDLKTSVTISFEDAAFGAEKSLRLKDQSGNDTSVKVRIPAGIQDGKTLRLRGKGKSDGRGNTGDILLEVHISPRYGYERKGDDLYTTASIPFTTAVLGGKASFDTIYGPVSAGIPAGTQSGSKIRLRGKGIQKMGQSDVHGDQYVTIQIEVPKNLSPGELIKLKEFEKEYRKSHP